MNLKDDTKRLINAFGVTGGEFDASAVAAKLLAPYVDKAEIDTWGNVAGYRFATEKSGKTLLLDAHIDQVGYIVTGITSDGFLRFQGIGAPEDSLPGSELSILTKSGPITGVVGWLPPSAPPTPDKPEVMPDFSRMFIDLGLTEKETRERVSVGDLIAYGCDAVDLADGALAGKATDGRACFMAIVYAMSLLKYVPLNIDVVVVGSTKEEFDSSGANARMWRDHPDYVIVLDTTGYVKPGAGVVIERGPECDERMVQRFSEIARAKKIPYTLHSEPEDSSTNTKYYQASACGSVTCLLSLPQKYCHSPVEIVKLSDIENTGKLLASFVESFDGTL